MKMSQQVTNLYSSWRNGLGFCALIHKKFPNIIPFSRLKLQNMADNCLLAFEAAQVVGMKTVLTPDSLSEKPGVVAFLNELRYILSKMDELDLTAEDVIKFQSKWFQKCGYFEEEVGHLFVQAEEENEVEADIVDLDEAETSQVSNFPIL